MAKRMMITNLKVSISKFLLCIVLLTAHCSLLTSTTSAHTFHTSLARVEYNKQEELVEITIQLFTHDLVKTLSRRTGRVIVPDKTKDIEKLTFDYVREKFMLKNSKGEIKQLNWVGMKQETETTWVYVETKMSEGLSNASIQNKLFFELFSNQANLVHLKFDDRKADLIFKPGDGFKVIPQKKAAAN